MCSALDKHGHSPASLAKIDAHLLHLLPVAGSNSRSAFSSHTHIHTSLSALASQKQRPGECIDPRLQDTLKYASADTWPLENARGHLAQLGVSMPEPAYDKEVCFPPCWPIMGCSEQWLYRSKCPVRGNQWNACKMTAPTKHYDQSYYWVQNHHWCLVNFANLWDLHDQCRACPMHRKAVTPAKNYKTPQEHASGRPGWTRSQKLLAVASSSKTQIKKHSTRFKM